MDVDVPMWRAYKCITTALLVFTYCTTFCAASMRQLMTNNQTALALDACIQLWQAELTFICIVIITNSN